MKSQGTKAAEKCGGLQGTGLLKMWSTNGVVVEAVVQHCVSCGEHGLNAGCTAAVALCLLGAQR